jgi:hypothetical protein
MLFYIGRSHWKPTETAPHTRNKTSHFSSCPMPRPTIPHPTQMCRRRRAPSGRPGRRATPPTRPCFRQHASVRRRPRAVVVSLVPRQGASPHMPPLVLFPLMFCAGDGRRPELRLAPPQSYIHGSANLLWHTIPGAAARASARCGLRGQQLRLCQKGRVESCFALENPDLLLLPLGSCAVRGMVLDIFLLRNYWNIGCIVPAACVCVCATERQQETVPWSE